MPNHASRNFDLGVLAAVSDGKRVVRYAPDLGLFATWHGPGVTFFNVWNDKGEEVDVFSTDADLLTDDDAGAAIVRHFNYLREQATPDSWDMLTEEGRAAWLRGMSDHPEGTTALCTHCHEPILLDQREGGGPGKDWGTHPDQWVGNGGTGMDYGCGDNPASDDEGTAGHEPIPETIEEPA
jgi:hypothetical protein